MTDDEHWKRLIAGLRAGDPQIAREFHERYAAILHRVADRHLPDKLRRRVGAEDVVQSVCRTFLRRAEGGEFQLGDSAGLWQLLCAITLTKVREQARYHLRQKRGLGQETEANPASSSAPGLDAVARGPAPDEAIEFADQFQQLLDSLDEEEREIVQLKLQELTNEQVAARLGCSERTVRRTLKRVESRFAAAFEGA